MLTRLRGFLVWVRETIRHEGYVILAWRGVVKLLSPAVELDAQMLFEFDLTQQMYLRCRVTFATTLNITIWVAVEF